MTFMLLVWERNWFDIPINKTRQIRRLSYLLYKQVYNFLYNGWSLLTYETTHIYILLKKMEMSPSFGRKVPSPVIVVFIQDV